MTEKPMGQRMAKLEARVAALEQRLTPIQYCEACGGGGLIWHTPEGCGTLVLAKACAICDGRGRRDAA